MPLRSLSALKFHGLSFHKCHLVFFFLFIGVQLLYNVVLFSAIRQSESAIYIYIYSLFVDFLPIRSALSTEWGSSCYTAGSHQSSVLYTAVCIMVSHSAMSNSLQAHGL